MAQTKNNLENTSGHFRSVAGRVSSSTKTPKPAQPVYGPSSQMAKASAVKGLKR